MQNRRRGMLSGGAVLLYDNARPHTAAVTQELLDQFGWETFDYLPYSPDLSPSDFHLFLKLKEFLGDKSFRSDEDLENAVYVEFTAPTYFLPLRIANSLLPRTAMRENLFWMRLDVFNE
ncbi:hypothetical protein AVEN_79873-1 [Araneus ventricosus]|uniref:Histone-lysine N-methyltransferase SETMAR n=1 Tax=Araneus ventricosus TaxID=182803 RepID=A0A4Y2DQP4_ARAVE|nr:hypothetical protein AVEN_79873-1 [Araneus ventricosus]